MAANRKFLQIAGSTLAKIAALTGENAVKEREILLATDTGTIIVGTGSGNYKQIGSVPSGTTVQRTSATPVEGQLYLDTTEVMLYRGNGTAWEKCVDAIPAVTSPTAGNLVKVKADGTLEDAGHAEADVQFKVASPTAGDVLTVDASGFMQDSGTALADLQTKVASATTDNLSSFNANGFVVDSGIAKADVQQKLSGATQNNVLVADANGFMADSGTAVADVQTKVSSATNGDLAGLDANGFVTDSGVLAADVQTKLTGHVTDNLLSVASDGFMADSGIAKADVQQKLTGATQDNILTVSATGFMQDSGKAFNDSGATANDIWSGAKITEYVTSSIAGMSWQAPVKSASYVPAANPSEGDRYLVVETATGAWVGKEGHIAEWDGTEWVFTTPVDGMAVFLEDTDHQMAYNGAEWVDISAGFTYTAGNGLDLTNNAFSVVAKTNGGIAVDNTGVAADVDTTSIVLDANGKIAAKVKSGNALNVDSTDGLNVKIDGSAVVLDANNALTVQDLDFGTF